ncbi:MAG: 6-bladed beta-propeller [Bacteroidetes bacterium]|nr:6-bladed beta-propeller [Bacteroidota bacterium]
MKKMIVLIFVMALLFSCSEKNQNTEREVEIIEIKGKDLTQTGNLSDMILGFSLVPLETDSSSLIIEVKKVILHKNHYYIFDESAQKILKFTDAGKFVRQISSRGEGPGEFIEIHDFIIDKTRDIIFVPDYYILHSFTLDGVFIKSLPLDFMGDVISQTNDDKFAFYGGFEGFRLKFVDTLGNLVSSDIPYSRINNAPVKYIFSSVADRVYFHLPACDTVFQIEDGKPKPAYFIDFGKKAYSQQFFNNLPAKIQNDMGNYLNNQTDRITFYSFLPTENHIFFQLSFSNNYYSGYYDKQSKKQLYINHNELKNDLFKSFFYFNPIGTSENKYIIAVPAHKFIDNKESNVLSTEENRKIISELSKYSNPVLMIAQPKAIE